LPATTVVGGVPDSVIVAAEVPVADGGEDEPVEEAAVLAAGELLSSEPHPESRAETLTQTSKADRNPKLLAANILRLNDGCPIQRKCRH